MPGKAASRANDDSFLLKMFLYHFENVGSQGEDRDQVGHDHEAVEGVGHVPHKAQIHRGTHNGNQGIGHVEGQDDLTAEQELGAPGAVQAPADDGGEGPAAHGHGGEDGHPAAVDRGEAGDGQLRPGGLAVGNGNAAE